MAEEEQLWNKRREEGQKDLSKIKNLLEEINETKGEEDEEDSNNQKKSRAVSQYQHSGGKSSANSYSKSYEIYKYMNSHSKINLNFISIK